MEKERCCSESNGASTGQVPGNARSFCLHGYMSSLCGRSSYCLDMHQGLQCTSCDPHGQKLSEQSLGDAFTCLGAAGPAAAFNSSATFTVFLSAVLMEQVSACSLQFSGQYHHKLDSAVTSHDGANSYQTFGQTYLLWLFG